MHEEDETRSPTDFDFENSKDCRRIDDWLVVTRAKLANNWKQGLSEKDREKMAELLALIIKNGGYKIPKKRGKRSTVLINYKQLTTYYCIKMMHEQMVGKEKAKRLTAERFATSYETIRTHYSNQISTIERLIQENGYEPVAAGFEEMLSRYAPVGSRVIK